MEETPTNFSSQLGQENQGHLENTLYKVQKWAIFHIYWKKSIVIVVLYIPCVLQSQPININSEILLAQMQFRNTKLKTSQSASLPP